MIKSNQVVMKLKSQSNGLKRFKLFFFFFLRTIYRCYSKLFDGGWNGLGCCGQGTPNLFGLKFCWAPFSNLLGVLLPAPPTIASSTIASSTSIEFWKVFRNSMRCWLESFIHLLVVWVRRLRPLCFLAATWVRRGVSESFSFPCNWMKWERLERKEEKNREK